MKICFRLPYPHSQPCISAAQWSFSCPEHLCKKRYIKIISRFKIANFVRSKTLESYNVLLSTECLKLYFVLEGGA